MFFSTLKDVKFKNNKIINIIINLLLNNAKIIKLKQNTYN